jgi:hypothetical protein
MPDRPSARRYEVTVLRDKRWLIDCLARDEDEARARAEELFADDNVAAVRVVRGRFGQDGTSFESVVLERVREARRGKRPVRIASAPEGIAWCDTLDDLYGPQSRRAIARLLRNFLDRYSITPTELLHHHRYIKQLERQDELMGQALQRVAAHQARARDVDLRQRVDVLDRLVNEASARARDALSSRAAPRFGEGGLVALAKEVATSALSPSEQAFNIRVAVSRLFEDLGDPAAKMETVAGWKAAGVPAGLVPLIDELAGGLLGAASLLQELVGPQPHLAAALATMADLAAGRSLGTAPAAPLLANFAKLLADPGMPETREILIERVQRELASDKPLSRDDKAGQRRLFNSVLDKLLDEHGLFVGGTAMIEAIARRSRRFEVIGGVEAVRFAAPDPEARLEQLVALASGVLGERQQRAVATYIAEILDRCDSDPAPVAALRPRLEAMVLPDLCKEALLERLPPPAPTRATAG